MQFEQKKKHPELEFCVDELSPRMLAKYERHQTI